MVLSLLLCSQLDGRQDLIIVGSPGRLQAVIMTHRVRSLPWMLCTCSLAAHILEVRDCVCLWGLYLAGPVLCFETRSDPARSEVL